MIRIYPRLRKGGEYLLRNKDTVQSHGNNLFLGGTSPIYCRACTTLFMSFIFIIILLSYWAVGLCEWTEISNVHQILVILLRTS